MLPKLGLTSFELVEVPERGVVENAIGAAIPQRSKLIALDEDGLGCSSEEFAQLLQRFRTDDASTLAFLIGGADGFPDTFHKKANIVLSLGRITLPHLLVRGVLAEQLYRAGTILLNHPYHRQGKSR